MTSPEITEQIHELILEDRRISAKSIAEQLSIWHEQVGSIIHEDLDIRKLSAKWVLKCLNANQKRQRCPSSEQRLEFFRCDPNDFLSRLATMDETWLYNYDPETKQQSMEWRHSGSPRPKKFRVQKPARKYLASIFGIKTASSSLIILQSAKLSTRSITRLCWCKRRAFWRKDTAGRNTHQRGLVLSRQCPGSLGTCNPEETGLLGRPFSWSPTLFSGSGPVRLSPVPWTENKIESSPFFVRRGGHCCCGDLVGRTTFWIFLSGLQTLEQRAKKCIELRGEYVE